MGAQPRAHVCVSVSARSSAPPWPGLFIPKPEAVPIGLSECPRSPDWLGLYFLLHGAGTGFLVSIHPRRTPDVIRNFLACERLKMFLTSSHARDHLLLQKLST